MRAIAACRTLACAVLVGLASPALAQHVIFNAPGLLGDGKAPPPAPPRAQTSVWPRLDAGAVFCRSEDDLERHAENMVARASGGETRSADCHAIAQPTGILILSREGPGRTQVKLKDPSAEVGWTDVWLPEKAPAGR